MKNRLGGRGCEDAALSTRRGVVRVWCSHTMGYMATAKPRDADHGEREFYIDNLLVRIHLKIEMILVDRPCAMGI